MERGQRANRPVRCAGDQGSEPVHDVLPAQGSGNRLVLRARRRRTHHREHHQDVTRPSPAECRHRTPASPSHPAYVRHELPDSGGDVFSLQAILGHTTLDMTRRYVTLASSHVAIQHRRFSSMDRMQAGSDVHLPEPESRRAVLSRGTRRATYRVSQWRAT